MTTEKKKVKKEVKFTHLDEIWDEIDQLKLKLKVVQNRLGLE